MVVVRLFIDEETQIQDVPEPYREQVVKALVSSIYHQQVAPHIAKSLLASNIESRLQDINTLLTVFRQCYPTSEWSFDLETVSTAVQTISVPSDTRAGLYHTVTVDRGTVKSCSCEGFTNHGYCKHVRREQENLRERLKSAQA